MMENMRAHDMKRNQDQQEAFNAQNMTSITFLADTQKQQFKTTMHEHNEEFDSPDNHD